MKRIFVDTNILLDLIADRKPFSKFAIDIFALAEKKKVHLFTSSHSIATTHYVLKKYVDEIVLRNILSDLLDIISIVGVDIDVVKKSLKSVHKDFEDAIQISSASSVKNIDCIVTRNTRDFKLSEIPVFSPEHLWKLIKDN